jgi:hypothetical protein
MKKLYILVVIVFFATADLESANNPKKDPKPGTSSERQRAKFSRTPAPLNSPSSIPEIQQLRNKNKELQRIHRQLSADLAREIKKIQDRDRLLDYQTVQQELEEDMEKQFHALKNKNESERMVRENSILDALNEDLLYYLFEVLEIHQIEEGRVPASDDEDSECSDCEAETVQKVRPK